MEGSLNSLLCHRSLLPLQVYKPGEIPYMELVVPKIGELKTPIGKCERKQNIFGTHVQLLYSYRGGGTCDNLGGGGNKMGDCAT